MAQLVEHIVHIDGVTGSSPVATTKSNPVSKMPTGFFLSPAFFIVRIVGGSTPTPAVRDSGGFEIDFNLANDGVLIACHSEDDWRRMTGSTLPYESRHFDEQPLCGQYESLNAQEVIELLTEHPDAYIITDTKDTTQTEVMLAFSQLVYLAQKTHPEVLARIIPQIYNEDMLPWVEAVYPFPSIIYTLYQVLWTPESVLDFCMNSGVRFITMPQDQVTEEALRLWDTLGIRVGVHTVNDPLQAQQLFDLGVDMLYTDFLTPADAPL